MKPSTIAKRYARDVLAGKIPAGHYVRLACKRFLDDVDRKRFAFYFDDEAADRALRFEQLMPHVKGKWAAKRQLLKYEPWQVFVEANVFGWREKKTKLRRFRRSYEEIPRKNAKSTRMAARGIYLFCADGETGAEVYSGATTEKQALEVFRTAWQMVQKLPALRERFGIEQAGNAKNPGPMYVLEDMSRFQTIIGKPGDGSSPHAAIVDEYHEHDSDQMVDAMQTGMGAREQPLLSIITTAGSNLGGPCYEYRRDVVRVLEGQEEDDRLFGIIYSIDEGDRWDDPNSLIKANPNYGVSVFEPFLLSELEQAKRSAQKQNVFRTKHLNQWVGARTAWMNMLAWQRQKRELKIEDFVGCRCWVGIDLASKLDVTAVVMLFEKNGAFYCIPRFYVPEKRADEVKRYRDYVTGGHMIATPGDMTDYGFIEHDLQELARTIELEDLAFDPAQAAYLMVRLQQAGLQVVEFPQTVRNMSDPMKEVEARVIARSLFHDGNPMMTWMMGNVTARLNAKEQIYPRKESEEEKIDGPVALIIAMGRALLALDGDDLDDMLVSPIIA